MKIVCDSCGAKYSIADEKVAGKVFKIRCKKCSSVIVVRGDQVAAEEEASTRVFDYGSDAVWHVVVNGEQQGPFVPSQIGSLLSEGTIDWEAYVWREGFDGWKSARDIPELVDAITGGGGSQSGAEAPTPAISPSSPPMGADPFAQTEAAGSAFGGGGGGGYAAQEPFPATQQASPFAQEQAFAAPREGAAVARRNAGADLFAQADASPFAGADTDDVVSSPPAAAATARVDSLTGQRNENSVLFSLANLQALATGTGGPAKSGAPSVAPASAAPSGRAPGEGSGLIDIRALASAGTGAPASSGRSGDVDDLLSIGAGPAPLGSPVLAPVAEGEGKGKYLLVGGLAFAGALVVALGVVVVILASQSPDEVAAAENPATGDITPTAGPTTGEDPAPEPTGAPTGENPAPTGGGTDPSGTGTPPVAEEREPSRPLTAEERRRLEQRREQERERRANEPERPAATPTSMEASTPRGNSDIDALLDKALGGGGGGREQPARMEEAAAPAPAGGGGGGLSDTPPRGAVLSAMQGISGAVRSCGGGQHGVANVRVTVQGSSGRVTNAVVSGQFSGTPVGSCIARAARGARFPRFANPTFSVSFPYRL